jgi:oligopeptide transport system permease protein
VKFLFSRLLQTLVVVFIVATITFFLLHILPGSPFDSETALTPDVQAHLESRYHLHDPVLKQYFYYLKTLGVGDLGTSYKYLDQNVTDLMKEAMPVTFELGFLSLLFSFLMGIPLGLVAARFQNTWIDRSAMLFATVGVSIPPFLFAPIVILFFSFWLDLLPPALWESPRYYILPVVTLGIRPAAMIARLVRSGALDVMDSDFVRTARSKGLPESVILFKHVLRNSLVPVLALTGPLIANLLSGSFVVEMLFAIPGMGHYFVDSVIDRDYPLIMSLTLFYVVILSFGNFMMDLLSTWLDPRIKIS